MQQLRCPTQVILEEGTPQMVVCPHCGMSESYEDFQRSVGHQASPRYAAARSDADSARSGADATHRLRELLDR